MSESGYKDAESGLKLVRISVKIAVFGQKIQSFSHWEALGGPSGSKIFFKEVFINLSIFLEFLSKICEFYSTLCIQVGTKIVKIA